MDFQHAVALVLFIRTVHLVLGSSFGVERTQRARIVIEIIVVDIRLSFVISIVLGQHSFVHEEPAER